MSRCFLKRHFLLGKGVLAATSLEVNRNSQGSGRGSCGHPPPRRTRTKVRIEAGSRREEALWRLQNDLSTQHPHPSQQSLGAGHAHPERRKPPYPCSVLDLINPQLHGHVKAMQDVSTEHQRVYRGVDCMDPAWGWGEEKVSHQPHLWQCVELYPGELPG